MPISLGVQHNFNAVLPFKCPSPSEVVFSGSRRCHAFLLFLAEGRLKRLGRGMGFRARRSRAPLLLKVHPGSLVVFQRRNTNSTRYAFFARVSPKQLSRSIVSAPNGPLRRCLPYMPRDRTLASPSRQPDNACRLPVLSRLDASAKTPGSN